MAPTTQNFSVDLKNSLIDSLYNNGVRRETIKTLEDGIMGDSYLSAIEALNTNTFQDFREQFDKNKNLDVAILASYKDNEYEEVKDFFEGYVEFINKKFNKYLESQQIIDWILPSSFTLLNSS